VARTAARRAGEGSRGRLNDGPIFPDLARPRILDGLGDGEDAS
jgi:hypothetical protein